ncbi:MAG: heparinase II/III family protein, partial [Acidobacteriota bacterium]|nr:heparinase II/III family protein [Acidobacteriota bacterium]
PFVKTVYEQQLAIGERLLTTPPDVYLIGGSEHTLLATSRDMEGRIFTLAGLYRLTGDKRFAGRATEEMLAAASFPDWYPKHFLDTGEMTAALGLGYDWLYPVLSPADRATIEHAIATKGIDPWLERIKSGEAIHHEHNNWNQVCNGGETIGALAIADVDPERARGIIDHARAAIGDIMKLFAPDGSFEEGPGYWNYATSYNVLFLDALDSALGTDFGMADAPGFSSTGDYHIQSMGPTYLFANFSDAGAGVYPSPQMFWFARRFHKPFYAEYERRVTLGSKLDPREARESSRFSIFTVFWGAEDANMTDGTPLPLVQSFSRVDQAYMRSAWNDPNAWYVAFKGGDAHASHGHLDLGAFIMDAFDQRWATDLGPDNYGLPGYFGRQRWTYYRMRTEGHNTLTIDGENEDLDAKAPLTASGAMGDSFYAIANLDQAYKGKLTSWSRGVALLDKKRVLVQDEIAPAQPVDVVWNFHTFADVKIAADGRSATLSEGGATLHARIVSPAAGRFSTASTQAPPPNAPNPGLTNLVINLPKQASAETIAVVFTAPGDNARPAIKPLSTWR